MKTRVTIWPSNPTSGHVSGEKLCLKVYMYSLSIERPFRTNTKERCPFHYRGLESKTMKLRDTGSNRKVWTWSTKWSRAKANRVLPRECTGHSKHPLPTTQEKTLHMDITRWSRVTGVQTCALPISQSAPGFVFADSIELLHLWLQRILSIWFHCWPSGDVHV